MDPDRRYGTLEYEHREGGADENIEVSNTLQGKLEKYTKQQCQLSLLWFVHSGLFLGIFLSHRTPWRYLASL